MALLDTVTKAMVAPLLGERPVGLLDMTYTDASNVVHPYFDDFVQKRGQRVVAIVGANPTNATVATLAAQCIAYGVASEFEYAAYPEQQTLGGGGRGYYLDQQFEKMRTELHSTVGAGAADSLPRGISRAAFPLPNAYPDPSVQYAPDYNKL